jgi:hypothetical protein
MTAKAAEVTDADEYLTDCPYFGCRAQGHAFRPEHDNWFVEGKGRSTVYTQTFKCLGCPTLRVDVLDTSFDLLHRRYSYPDGYLVRGISITRRDVRRWQITQQLAREQQRPRGRRPR